MTDPVAPPQRRRRPLGCLLRVAVALLVLAGIVVAIGVTFDQGPGASQPAGGFDAGPQDAYQRAAVSYLEAQHTYIVRLPDGTLLALYDRSARQQELGGPCRVAYQEHAVLPVLSQIAGMTGAFVEECSGLRTVWRVDGQFAAGAGYGDLDRFDTRVTSSGHLFVTDRRSCTRSLGAPGVPPYHADRCRGNG